MYTQRLLSLNVTAVAWGSEVWTIGDRIRLSSSTPSVVFRLWLWILRWVLSLSNLPATGESQWTKSRDSCYALLVELSATSYSLDISRENGTRSVAVLS